METNQPKTPLLDTPIAENYYRKRIEELQTAWANEADPERAEKLQRELQPYQTWFANKNKKKDNDVQRATD